MGIKPLLLLLAFVIASEQGLIAQSNQGAQPAGKVASTPQTQLNKLEKLSEIQQWVASMRDECLSATTMARLADTAWPVDEVYARSLFRFALSKVAVGQTDEAKLIATKNTANRRIMTLIARRDVNWSKALVDASTTDAGKRASTQLEIANDLLETDPERAADLAAQSMQSEVNQGLIAFVNALRRRDPVRADQMFGQLLNSFLSQPNLTANNFAMLGTYLFRSRFADLDDGIISMQRIGDIMLPDITGDRPGASPALISSYLRGAIGLLQRPVLDEKQRQERYALGYMLLPKAQQVAPNLVGEMMNAMGMLATHVPAQYTNGEAYKYLRKMPGAPADRIAEIEKMAGSGTRDQLFLDVVLQTYRKKDFETASLAASKIDDSKLEDELELLIQFGETNVYLTSKTVNLGRGFELVEKVPDSVEKCLLRLSLASIAAKAGDKKLEEELLELTRLSAKNLDSQAAPFLLLYISGKLKVRKDLRSGAVFDEATKLFNKHESIRDPILEHPVSKPPITLRFPIKVDQVDLDFGSMFHDAVRGDEEAAISLVSHIKDERLRGLAYISLAKAIVAKKPAAPPRK
ncbi:MAG: hypothetical protein WKF34_06970 [Pyrinomonadaceae bacterium]